MSNSELWRQILVFLFRHQENFLVVLGDLGCRDCLAIHRFRACRLFQACLDFHRCQESQGCHFLQAIQAIQAIQGNRVDLGSLDL